MAIALTDVFVWDGIREMRSDAPWTIRVEEDRIAALGPDPSLADGAEAVACRGATALPGLIDAHVHLTLDPALRTPAEQLALTPAAVAEGAARRARRMLASGITTARDLGGGAGIELELRDRINRGELLGPRLVCARQPVTLPKGHCHFWGGGARNEAEVAEVIERQIEGGADWIKVMATGGVFTPGTSARDVQFDCAELERMVGLASRHGRSVAAHCHATAGIRNAVRAGVRTIEHCSFVGEHGFGSDFDQEVVDEIARHESWVSPTVNGGWSRRFEKDGAATSFALRMVRVLRSLVGAGVPILASTDAGIPGVEHHRLCEGLCALATLAGLTPVEALRCATSESARGLGLEGETGVLAPGLAADVLVVDGDPTRDLEALRRPLHVVSRGRIVRGEPVEAKPAQQL